MKTIFIYSQIGYDNIKPKFFIVNGDYRHLDGIYINDCDPSQKEKETELTNLIYDEEGDLKVKFRETFPGHHFSEAYPVITCGFFY